MNSKVNQEAKNAAERKNSEKIKFFEDNFNKILNLENDLRFALSEVEIKKDHFLVLKVCEGGWLPFKDVYKLQKIYDDEKSFFQALSFVKRIEICQNVNSSEFKSNGDQNSTESLMIKLNENFGKPIITFYLKNNSKNGMETNDVTEQKIQDLINSSIFKKHIKDFEIKSTTDQNSFQAKIENENSQKKLVKIQSDVSAVISGLKCFLNEYAQDLVTSVSENFFNIDAAPFTPKTSSAPKNLGLDGSGPPLDLGFARKSTEQNVSDDPETTLLEKKRQISQMYQYYNYLIFEKNKEHFNDINPDLRKMTYKYDSEVKNSYMTVQASPEVIKAAMGMNVQQNQNKSDLELNVQPADMAKDEEVKQESQKVESCEEAKDKGSVERTSALKLMKRRSSSPDKSGKIVAYSKNHLLRIYKGLGDFKSPLSNFRKYGIQNGNEQYLELVLNEEPDVVLQSMKQLPPQEAYRGNKGKIVSSIIDSNISQTQK